MRSRLTVLLKYVVLVPLALIFVMPFIWMVALSVKNLGNFYEYPPQLLTPQPAWSNYNQVLEQFSLFRYLLNSLIVAGTITALQLVTASMAGFAFAMLSFRGKHAIFMLFLASMMIPGTVILIPLFKVVLTLRLIDRYSGLILPFMFTGYGTFLMRQFFRSLPRELFAAARIDGANYFQIYWTIFLPLARPVLASLGTLAFVAFWNSLLWPLVATNSDEMKTIAVGIAGLVGQNASYPHLIMAGATIAVMPTIALFIVLQRYFTQGFVMSGMKG